MTRTATRRPALILAALAAAAVATLAVHAGAQTHARADSIWTVDSATPSPSPSGTAGTVSPADSIWTG